MNSSDFVLPKPTMVARWKRGWIILWKTVVFQFWIGLYSLPMFIAGQFLQWNHTGTTKYSPATFVIGFLIVLINLPIAYCLASETTGFFEKGGESKDGN